MAIKTVVTLVALLTAASAQAATLEFLHGDAAKFKDVRTVDPDGEKFRETVLREVEAGFRREAGKLPADQVLKITLTNLDLAGEIEYFVPGFSAGVRLIRNADFPAMELSYELRSAAGQILKSGDDKFSYLGFRDDVLVRHDNSLMSHEKRMISEWFERTLLPPPVSLRDQEGACTMHPPARV